MNMEISGGDGGNLILKELAMNDLHSRITALGVTPDDKWLNEYELKLKGTDSFGNPVSFEGAGFGPENELRFETSVFGDYEEGDVVDEDNFQMSLPDKNCQYLDLQLYQRKSGGIYNQQNNWMMNIMYRKKLILTRYIQKKIIMDGNRLGRSFESK